jgi:hypothetical protein
MDSVRAKFLPQYHMAKWEMVIRPEEGGGSSRDYNTRTMNDYLLMKWIWKILQEPEELWFKLVKAKYMSEVFFYSNVKGSSKFWQGLRRVKHR